MDPYLEPHWRDAHGGLIAESRKHLNRSLPDGLVARMDERLVVDAEDAPVRRIGPDVFVSQDPLWPSAAGDVSLTIDAPFQLLLDSDPVIERYIQIFDPVGQLITVIEFLSPSNKTGDGIAEFQKKRAELLSARVHLVEIDLVRAGDWLALFEPRRFPPKAASTYRAIVRTGSGRPAVGIFPIRLPDVLPDVPVPLRPGDPAVALPLQQLIETVYTDGRYGRTLKYDQPLDPPLSADEAAYAAERIAARAGTVV
jgi:hypothetical protein